MEDKEITNERIELLYLLVPMINNSTVFNDKQLDDISDFFLHLHNILKQKAIKMREDNQ